MSQKDDMEAINFYMMSTPPKTDAAKVVKDSWVQWWNLLSAYDKWFNVNAYDEARNRRNAFNRSNVSTPEEAAAVEEVIRSGITSEEQEGQADRRLTTGDFPGSYDPRASGPMTVVAIAGLWGAAIYLLTRKKS